MNKDQQQMKNEFLDCLGNGKSIYKIEQEEELMEDEN